MKNITFSGKLSFIWILALAALLYTGYNLLADVKADEKMAAQVFTENGTYPSLNNTLLDLLR